MTYHIAELIERARNARGLNKADAEDRCRDAILQLWTYRRELEGRRPTDRLEPLIDMLAHLNPDKPDTYYYRQIWHAQREEAVKATPAPLRHWLDVAQATDVAARSLIGWSLGHAASEAEDQSKPWVELARRAGAADDSLVTLMLDLQSMLPDHDRDDLRPAILIRKRLNQLKSFRKAAATMEAELRHALERAEMAEGATQGKGEEAGAL